MRLNPIFGKSETRYSINIVTFFFSITAPLDIPEQFLLQLAEIQHFAERVECLQLQKHFNEAMFNIGNNTIH